ncbi:MAG: hypothetical protein HQK83_20530, partial [Fibrobacteria bacterium]|nr:hypothetical protein [Fibrobacteria bacterium]
LDKNPWDGSSYHEMVNRSSWYGELELEQEYAWFLTRRTTLRISNTANLLLEYGHYHKNENASVPYRMRSRLDNLSDRVTGSMQYYFHPRFSLNMEWYFTLNYYFDSEYNFLETANSGSIRFSYDLF